MQDYKDDVTYAKEEAAEEVADLRYQRIVEEMEKLGWNTSLYSPECGEEDFSKWQEYLFQPKEFTLRSTSIPHSNRIAAHIFLECRLAHLTTEARCDIPAHPA